MYCNFKRTMKFYISVILIYVSIQICHSAPVKRVELVYSVSVPPDNVIKDLNPIILLHGLTSTKETWKYIAPDIAKSTGRKIYMLDARNHGDSPWTTEFSVDILADDVVHFMENHNITKAVFVGHSMGGRTAIIISLKKPDKVEKLISEDMSTADATSRDINNLLLYIQAIEYAMKRIPRDADEMTAKKFLFNFFKTAMPDEAPDTRKDEQEFLETLPIKKEGGRWIWKSNLKSIKQFLNHGQLNIQQENQYYGDALFIHGTKSVLNVGRDEEIIKRYFPKAQMIGLEAGHMIHSKIPKQFSETVIKFVNT